MGKNFKSAAESFITSASAKENLSTPLSNDAARNTNKEKKQETTVTRTKMAKEKRKERKSRRVNLLMYPSLVDCLKEKAEEEDTSLNDLMCRAAEEFLKNNYSN